MSLLKGFLALSNLLKPGCEKGSKENFEQISKNKRTISTYRTEVFA